MVSKEELIVKEIFNFYSNFYSDRGMDCLGIEGINWAPVELVMVGLRDPLMNVR